jgi:hypothetical protein
VGVFPPEGSESGSGRELLFKRKQAFFRSGFDVENFRIYQFNLPVPCTTEHRNGILEQLNLHFVMYMLNAERYQPQRNINFQ